MAIATEFIDFIVPIKVIEQKYPGGWEQCLEDHKDLIGGRVWYDKCLFRDGAMNPMDIESLVNKWTDLGFKCTAEVDGKNTWQDVCVFEMMFGGPTMPCEWIAFDAETRSAYLKGTSLEEVKGRDSYQ